MLEGLFGEQDFYEADHLVSSSKIPLPPQERGETKLAGLLNQGALCYLNRYLLCCVILIYLCFSLIQTLVYTPELCHGLFQLSPGELGLGSGNSSDQGMVLVMDIMILLYCLTIGKGNSSTAETPICAYALA